MPVEGYGTDYFINEFGEVLSFKRYPEGRLLLQKTTINGYKAVVLYNRSYRKDELVHRLLAKTYFEGEGQQVNHIDGCKTNNHISNLEWVTARENVAHAINTGLRVNFGENSPHAVLTEDLVFSIRTMRSNGSSYTEISSKLNVNISTVADVVKRRTWRHI